MGFFKKTDAEHWKYCYQTIYFIAAVNLLFGVLSIFINYELLRTLGGPYLLIGGVIFSICAVMVHKKKNIIAAWVAAVYWSFEILSSVYYLLFMKQEIFLSGLLMKVFLLYYLYAGLGPIKRLKNVNITPVV